MRGIKLNNVSLIHDDEPIISDDSVDAVSNSEDSSVLKLLLYHILYQMVSGFIYARCCFIHYQHSTFAKD